jgi:intein/homing endonuclease
MVWNRKFTDEEFLRLYAENLSDEAIAKILGVHRVSVRLRRVKLNLKANDPIKTIVTSKALDEHGAYVIGALLGDKSSICCYYNQKQRKWFYQVSLSAGLDYDFAEAWLRHLRFALGKDIGFIYKAKKNSIVACTDAKRAYLYVTQFIKPEWRSYNWQVPNAVKEANTKVISLFLRGLFDAEGTVGSYYVSMAIKNYGALLEVKKLLEKLDIYSYLVPWKTRPQFWTLYITRERNLKRYRELIGFEIKRKQIKLDEIITNKKWWRFEGRSKQVLEALGSFPDGATALEIANKLGIRMRLVSYSLKFLKRKGKVKFVGDTRWGKWHPIKGERLSSEASTYTKRENLLVVEKRSCAD